MTAEPDGRDPNVRVSQPGGRRKKLVFFVKLAISVSLIAYLFTLFDVTKLRESLSGIKPVFIVFAVSLLLVQSVLSTAKWRALLLADGVRIRFLYLLKTYLISNFMSLFLPTSFGGDIYRVMAVRKVAKSTAKTASSVLFDRLTGLFALLSLACAGYVMYPGLPYKWVVAVLYTAGILLFWLGASGRIVVWLGSTRNSVLEKIRSVFVSFHTYAKNRKCLILALIISFAFQFNIVVINKLYSLAINLDIEFLTLLAVIPLVYLTEAIPFSINGLGFRESAFVFFYQLIGQSGESGFAIALIVLTMRYSMGIIGGCLWLLTIVRDREATNAELNRRAP